MRATAKDVVTLAIGLGVLPLAWLVWTNSCFLSGPLIAIPITSLIWVPAGLLLLTLWFHDNPPSRLPRIASLWRRLQSSRELAALAFPLVTATLFLALLALAFRGLDVTGQGLPRAGDRAFFAGLFTFFAGLLIAASWLGQKEDYSRTAYITGGGGPQGQSMLKPFPRANPGPQPSENQRNYRKSSAVLADLFGFSVVIAGLLLMFVSSLLG